MRGIFDARPVDDTAGFQDHVSTSARHRGESSKGLWSLRVIDVNANGSNGVFQSAKLRAYGTAA
jgi:subtilisin-like proprotein convertase family protein